MYDYRKLRGKIKECYDTQNAFAGALGISKSALSARLLNKTSFSQREIIMSCELLHIEDSDIRAYFFYPESSGLTNLNE